MTISRGGPSVPPRPAASVLLMRDSAGGVEVLYLRRHADIAFQGGAWVFPGGRIEDADRLADDADEEAAARRAAVREAGEEAGLRIAGAALRLLCHWTTPESSPIRFGTWFFAAAAPEPDAAITIDGREIIDWRWMRPADAVRAQQAGTMQFGPPAFALSSRVAGFRSVAVALATIAEWQPEWLLGRLLPVEGGQVVVYPGDVAFEDGDLTRAGPHHRLWLMASGWRYEREL